MRAIFIKKTHHSYVYYVLWGILLLSSVTAAAKQPDTQHDELFQDAQKQQQLLITKYGLSPLTHWQKKCHEMITALDLNRFEQCLVLKTSFTNAYSLAHGVVLLTEGLLNNIHNNDQLAHVLAHEHAHLLLNHHQQAQQMVLKPPTFFTKSRLKKFYRTIETQADTAANQHLKQHQLDPLQIHHYLLRIENAVEENSSDHQKLKHRIQRKNLPEERLDPWWINHQNQSS